jgi:tetratricopeptide (TPR) repeat protein
MTRAHYIIILIFIFLTSIAANTAAQRAGSSEYENIILRAEQFMDQRNFRQAKAEYENALRVNPDASYPRIKLLQIREEYVDPDDAGRYNNYISEGNRLFDARNFSQAREQYFWANVLKPDEKHPVSRIKEIDEQLKELERKQKIYDKTVRAADSLYNLKEYQAAMNEYLYASGLLPSEAYARSRVNEINQIFETARQEQRAYEKAVEEADELYMIQDYNAALEAYSKALKMRPGESYPLSMLDRINSMADDQRSVEAVYAQVVENADRLFSESDFNAARSAYEHALRLMPGEQHPKDKILQIEAILAERAMSDEAWEEALAFALQHYQNNEFDLALTQYRTAEKIKPLPEQDAVILKEIVNFLEAEKQYKDALDIADKLFASAKYEEARDQYTQVLSLKPDATHPASRINEIDTLLANLEQLEANYLAAITTADQAFENKDYELALESYRKAANLKPAETHPKQRLEKTQTVVDLLSLASQHFANQDYQSALEQYKRAQEILPLKDELLAKMQEIEVLIENEKAYSELRALADELFQSKEYTSARDKYAEALQLKPGATHDSGRIDEIDAILAGIAEAEQAYTSAISEADRAFNNKDFEQALEAYQLAVSIKPEEEYPQNRAAETEEKIEEMEARQLAYNENISTADAHYNSGQYQLAIAAYQEALKFKASDQYAENRITEARSFISEAEINEAYDNALASARFHENNGDLISALESWKTAASLKPDESLPRNKIAELGALVVDEIRRIQQAYDKAIADGDRYFNTKVFDQAIEAYTEAGNLKPDETYPAEQIDAIRKYIEERAIVDLVSDPVSIVTGDEKRFDFAPVDMRVRRNNYVIITMRFSNTESSRFFLNYGLDGQRSGGIVVRNPGGKEENQFIVRVSSQDRWYRIDNNWISIYPEGSDIEITQLRISSGD